MKSFRSTSIVPLILYVGLFIPGKEVWYPLSRRLGGPRAILSVLEKIKLLPLPGFELGTVCPKTGRYTYYAIAARTNPICGPGSSVGIATDYGLDGPGIESRWGEIFRPSRPGLSPTQPPVHWVPGPSRG